MSRLTDADARRLTSALAASSPSEADRGRPSAQAGEPAPSGGSESAARLQRLFSNTAALDELGHAITIALASYLNRPVRCSVSTSTPPVANACRFEAKGREFTWWLDLDVDLTTAFADAMIGGDGTGRIGRGRRVRALVERIAAKILASIATAAGIEAPASVAIAAEEFESGPALAGGLCAVAADQFAWQIGTRLSAAVTATPLLREPHLLLDRVGAGAGHEASPVRPYAPQPPEDADGAIRAAIHAFRARLEETLRCRITAQDPAISRLDRADVARRPTTSLGLALTAGGRGAVVAFLDGEAVASLAAGTVGATVCAADSPGEVALAAAEAVVRDALGNAARSLPGIASDDHRIVRLSDNPLPALTPHHAIDVRFSVGGRAGSMQLLVPSWMLSHAGRP